MRQASRTLIGLTLAALLVSCVQTAPPTTPTVGYFVNFDGGAGDFRFTTFLQDQEATGRFDLKLYATFAEFEADVAAGSTPELMFFSFSEDYFDTALWSPIETYLAEGQGRAVVMTYCMYEDDATAVWGLGVAADLTCYESDDVVEFDLDPAITSGNDDPLELTMTGYSWIFAATSTAVDAGIESFCTDAADPNAVCGVYHADYPAALALWLPEAMVGGQDDELLLQIADSL